MDISDLLETVTFKHHRTPVFKHGSSECQYFLAFPKHVIDYIIANPRTPKQWKKLIQTCKLWFEKNPIVVVSCLHFSCHLCSKHIKGWTTCSSACCHGDTYKAINFVNPPIKLWITENLELFNANLSQGLIPHLYKCDVKRIKLCNNDKRLSFEELLCLTSSIVNLRLVGFFEDNNGEKVSFEKIIECLPASLEAIEYYVQKESFTPNTFKKLSEIEHVKNFKTIKLFGHFYATFDFDGLLKFMFENKQIWFDIDFLVTSVNDEVTTKIKNFGMRLQNEEYGANRRPYIRVLPFFPGHLQN